MARKAKHGWENHNGGKPPFEGAAPPIHLQDGGKHVKGDSRVASHKFPKSAKPQKD